MVIKKSFAKVTFWGRKYDKNAPKWMLLGWWHTTTTNLRRLILKSLLYLYLFVDVYIIPRYASTATGPMPLCVLLIKIMKMMGFIFWIRIMGMVYTKSLYKVICILCTRNYTWGVKRKGVCSPIHPNLSGEGPSYCLVMVERLYARDLHAVSRGVKNRPTNLVATMLSVLHVELVHYNLNNYSPCGNAQA